jgi:hypothetical protein
MVYERRRLRWELWCEFIRVGRRAAASAGVLDRITARRLTMILSLVASETVRGD